MASMESLRERLEVRVAGEAHLGVLWRVGTSSSGLLVALLIGALGLAQPLRAAHFTCTSGDVTCLIAAINKANGKKNTINLEPGTYTLTAIDNGIDSDSNGLPVITGTV